MALQLESFEKFAATRDHVLLRVVATWVGRGEPDARLALQVRRGGGVRRYTALPGPSHARSARFGSSRFVRAGFAVPAEHMDGAASFRLDAGPAGALELPDPVAPARPDSMPERGGRAQVLLAGHAPPESQLLRQFLARRGYTVAEAPDDVTAARIIVASAPEAVVTGARLGADTGLGLVRLIRKRYGYRCAGTAILIVAAEPSAEWTLRAYDAGADRVVAKPLDLDVLERELWAVIRRIAPAEQVEIPPYLRLAEEW